MSRIELDEAFYTQLHIIAQGRLKSQIETLSIVEEREWWDKEFSLYQEYGLDDMTEALQNTFDYRTFEMAERGEMSIQVLRQLRQEMYNSSAELAEAIYITM